MRRILAPFLAASLLTLLPGGIAAAAAAPAQVGAHQQVAAGDCPRPQPYPPPPDATVEVDTNAPDVGDSLDTSGIDYCPNEDVDLTIAGEHVGTAHTDTAGRFDRQLTTPGPTGAKRLCGIGASGLPRDRSCLTIHVEAASPSGATAFTGVQIALLGVLALILVVGGVVVATVGRNRRPERA